MVALPKNKLIKGLNPLLQYVVDLMSFFSAKTITVPSDYREQVLSVKKSLREDVSGMVNTVLDFAMTCAWVNYRVDCSNQNLEDELNIWLDNINSEYRGKIPTGLEPLAKEYFRERWKGSSHLVLRTFWEKDKRTGLELPMTMFFVDGEDLKCKPPKDSKVIVLGEEKYSIRLTADEKDDVNLPSEENEVIFVQKPFESWGTYEPVPWLIRQGIWRNMQLMSLLVEKGEFIVGRALEYLLLIKKGSEGLAGMNINYSEDDLKKVTQDLQEVIERKKSEGGAATYATQFDTELEHFIPEYSRIMDEGLYAPIERKILAGLGLVDIVQGTSSTRREAVLNPKPFVGEVKQGVRDFKALLMDIVKEIIERNDTKHKKWMNESIEIASSPIKDFLDSDAAQMLRSLYDRGLISKRTATEILGDIDYDIERQRRIQEEENGDTLSMYPPVVQNIEGQPVDILNPEATIPQDTKEDVPPDKKGPEKKNYNNSSVDVRNIEPYAGTEQEFVEALYDFSKEYEEAPYKRNADLPPAVRKYPKAAQDIFRNAFNNALIEYKDETTAFKVAWSALKKHMSKK